MIVYLQFGRTPGMTAKVGLSFEEAERLRDHLDGALTKPRRTLNATVVIDPLDPAQAALAVERSRQA
jgi:hypothetical protein